MIIKSIVSAAVVAVLLTGCAGTTNPVETPTPQAEGPAWLPPEFCVYNETETPMEVRWKDTNLGNDGDKTGTHAITRSNSGKVCGYADAESGTKLEVAAANVLITHVRSVGPKLNMQFYSEAGEKVCDEIISYNWDQGDERKYGCGSTVFTITTGKNTKYRHFLVSFESLEPYTPENFK